MVYYKQGILCKQIYSVNNQTFKTDVQERIVVDTPLIISVSGLRGEIGRTLTPVVAARYAVAFESTLKRSGPIVVTRDGRRSGAMLADVVCATLNALGRDTLDGGIAATPTTGVLIRQFQAVGGIQISASHNPAQFNGLKLFSAAGRIIPKQAGQDVLTAFSDEKNEPKWADVNSLGTRQTIDDTLSVHLAAILKTVDVNLIRKRKFKVLLDSNRGAGSLLARKCLEALGCETTVLGGTPDGLFEHVPEPTQENLQEVASLASSLNIDIVFCQDPDADRLALIDEKGCYPGEEYTLALCALNKLEKADQSVSARDAGRRPLVINCATSRMTCDVALKYGRQTLRSAVGEANVVDLMLQQDAMFGGEGNGGPIDPLVGYVRDSCVGMANLLELMARRQATVSELVASLPRWYIVKRKLPYPLAAVPALLDRLEKVFAAEKIDRSDGLRFDRAQGWVLVRGSNTESIIRIIAESDSLAAVNGMCDEVERAVQAANLDG
ncbi:MAG: phosphoglucosamine mutase [Thermoguttaceae bacterium]|nr:phosphoglucosamine mutase [Thermoguttaceae bacterium]